MRRNAIAVAAGALVALGMASAPAGARDNVGGGPAVTVVNFPLDANGNLRFTGSATVNGTVGATQSGPWSVGQSGPWSVGQSGSWAVEQSGTWAVGLEGPASTALARIDAATAGLRYDDDGNLKVSITGGSAADPSVADRSPFGWSSQSSFSGTINVAGPPSSKVTAYSFHASRDVIALFSNDGSPTFGMRIPAGQSLVGSFHHAILADSLQLQCLGGGECIVLISTAGY